MEAINIETKRCWRCRKQLAIKEFISRRHHICEKCRKFKIKIEHGKFHINFL